jgi:hypothetical protein
MEALFCLNLESFLFVFEVVFLELGKKEIGLGSCPLSISRQGSLESFLPEKTD